MPIPSDSYVWAELRDGARSILRDDPRARDHMLRWIESTRAISIDYEHGLLPCKPRLLRRLGWWQPALKWRI